ncbi:MAG: HAMP domain-containing sensor histidine kinase [Erysipelotrichaceae bacterium]|nr:HAMP domain-containing sensor histidine kinase [Erysipelotrichaceae bacterium]
MRNKFYRFTNGIAFKTWMYYVIFSLCILLLLLVFQIILFEPYYQNFKTKDIKKIVNSIANNIQDDLSIQTITINNDGCSVIVRPDKSKKGIDAIGMSCLIYNNGKIDSTYLDELKNSETGEIRYIAEVEGSQEMLIYGKTFYTEEEKPYYVIFNTPIKPLKSTIQIMRNQFVIIAGLVLLLSLWISIYFSRRLTKPITNITKEAKKLSTGSYDVHFEKGEFKEVNDLAETLNYTSKELSQIDELRKDLIANVSHDIKTPLTMIKAYAEMIRDISGSNKKKRNEHLDVIISESEYLDRLVSDMRELSKMQAGVNELNLTDFDLGSIIKDTVYKFKTITKEEQIHIEVDIEPELVCHADRTKIKEVLYNFIGNAIKHYGEDKKVIVKAFLTNKNMIRIEVTDHGNGIEPHALNHIWERYYKVDKHYQRAHSGTGLGLAISKEILEQHHAIYGATSEIGKGSTFYFELPQVII